MAKEKPTASADAAAPKRKRSKKRAPEKAVAPVKGRRSRKRTQADDAPAPAGEDLMSQAVALCQEQRWREAALVFRRMCEKADSDGNMDMYISLSAARLKVEYSLRRQMVASLVGEAKTVLAKEYLLDVG